MDDLKVVSLNAKGLNVLEKRKVLLNGLRRCRADVTFVQETHFRKDRLLPPQKPLFCYLFPLDQRNG